MFREVELPPAIKGRLLLHSMPGFQEPLGEALDEIKREVVDEVLCLTSTREVEARSPEYARAIKNNTVGAGMRQFPITDMSADANPQAFAALAKDTAMRLQRGDTVLAHCAFGIGRTGTVATLVLMALGLAMPDALDRVIDAGSRPESMAQLQLIRTLSHG